MCPHGDPFCPCPDGDACHYEGPDPMPCPHPPALSEFEVQIGHPTAGHAGTMPVTADPNRHHCHVEGCSWFGSVDPDACGIARIAPDTPTCTSFDMGCGAIRRLVSGTNHAPA